MMNWGWGPITVGTMVKVHKVIPVTGGSMRTDKFLFTGMVKEVGTDMVTGNDMYCVVSLDATHRGWYPELALIPIGAEFLDPRPYGGTTPDDAYDRAMKGI